MMFMPYYFFFLTTLFIGTLMSISSFNWLYVWMGLEINLISFIPLVMSSGADSETESSLKYFLVQAMGSGLLLFGSLVTMNTPNSMIPGWVATYIIIFSLMVKLGMAPFHYWLPHVMSGVSWMSCLLLSVWQKIGPLFVLSVFIYSSSYYIYLVCCVSALVGGLGGINQTQMRVLLAYSSIGHMGWMMASMMYSFSIFFMYFLTYSIINIGIMIFMDVISVKNTNIMGLKSLNFMNSVFVCVMFLSLAGLPPFLGFFPKWMVMSSLMTNGMFFISFVLVMGSLMNIYYYLNIFFNVMLNSFFSTALVIYKGGESYKVFVSQLLGAVSTFSLGLVYLFMYAMVLFYKS